jgi:type II secretory pathway pseudopilin PulG
MAAPIRSGDRRAVRGFTLIGLLFLVAGLGLAMAAFGVFWQTSAQREKERELLFVGEQYRAAIASYWQANPGAPALPASLEHLLSDPRFPKRRHLRRLYRDPVTGGALWGLIMRGGGIAGVYSLADARPLKTVGFGERYERFESATRYSEWRFDSGLGAGKLVETASPAGEAAEPNKFLGAEISPVGPGLQPR